MTAELWDAVEKRRAGVAGQYAGKPNGTPGRRTHYPFTGLLRCGVCGHRMVYGGGSSAHYYRCNGAITGGVCKSDRPVREDVLVAAAIAELKRILLQPGLQDMLQEKIRSRLSRFQKRANTERQQLESEAKRSQPKIDRLVAFIGTTDPGSTGLGAVRKGLDKATARQREIELRLASLRLEEIVEPRVPAVEEIAALELDIEARIKDDPMGARNAMHRLLGEGGILMQPSVDGSYTAKSVIFPCRLCWKTRKPRSRGTEAAGTSKCGEPYVGFDG